MPQQPPVYAPPAPSPAPAAPAKKPGKKKGLVIGLICGLAAVAVAAAIFAVVFMGNSKRYEEATELVSQHRYDEAIEIFQDLGGYSDSQEQAEFNVHYQKAQYLMNSAASGNLGALSVIQKDNVAMQEGYGEILLYQAAYDIFLSLGDYKDSARLSQQCLYGVGQIHLRHGNWDQVEDCMDRMDEATASAFFQEYQSYCADASALEDLRRMFQETAGMDAATSAEVELCYLLPYEEMHFADKRLGEQMMKYLDAVKGQAAVVGELNTIDGYLEYSRNAILCSEVIDVLIAEYGFMADDPEFIEDQYGRTEINRAYYHIYTMLHEELGGQDTSTSGGQYVLYATNTTEYDFTLSYSIKTYRNNTLVYTSYQMEMDFAAGETVTLPTGYSTNYTFTRWNISYNGLSNIRKNGELLPNQD